MIRNPNSTQSAERPHRAWRCGCHSTAGAICRHNFNAFKLRGDRGLREIYRDGTRLGMRILGGSESIASQGAKVEAQAV